MIYSYRYEFMINQNKSHFSYLPSRKWGTIILLQYNPFLVNIKNEIHLPPSTFIMMKLEGDEKILRVVMKQAILI